MTFELPRETTPGRGQPFTVTVEQNNIGANTYVRLCVFRKTERLAGTDMTKQEALDLATAFTYFAHQLDEKEGD